MSDLGELIYFPVMAKGLQLACIAEMSGLPWTGFTVEESGPKSWTEIKDSGIAPFGQMPLLKTPGGLVLGQSVAIANYIAKMAGAALEGGEMKAHPGGGRAETLRDHAGRQSLGAGLHEGAEGGEAVGMGKGGKRRDGSVFIHAAILQGYL